MRFPSARGRSLVAVLLVLGLLGMQCTLAASPFAENTTPKQTDLGSKVPRYLQSSYGFSLTSDLSSSSSLGEDILLVTLRTAPDWNTIKTWRELWNGSNSSSGGNGSATTTKSTTSDSIGFYLDVEFLKYEFNFGGGVVSLQMNIPFDVIEELKDLDRLALPESLAAEVVHLPTSSSPTSPVSFSSKSDTRWTTETARSAVIAVYFTVANRVYSCYSDKLSGIDGVASWVSSPRRHVCTPRLISTKRSVVRSDNSYDLVTDALNAEAKWSVASISYPNTAYPRLIILDRTEYVVFSLEDPVQWEQGVDPGDTILFPIYGLFGMKATGGGQEQRLAEVLSNTEMPVSPALFPQYGFFWHRNSGPISGDKKFLIVESATTGNQQKVFAKVLTVQQPLTTSPVVSSASYDLSSLFSVADFQTGGTIGYLLVDGQMLFTRPSCQVAYLNPQSPSTLSSLSLVPQGQTCDDNSHIVIADFFPDREFVGGGNPSSSSTSQSSAGSYMFLGNDTRFLLEFQASSIFLPRLIPNLSLDSPSNGGTSIPPPTTTFTPNDQQQLQPTTTVAVVPAGEDVEDGGDVNGQLIVIVVVIGVVIITIAVVACVVCFLLLKKKEIDARIERENRESDLSSRRSHGPNTDVFRTLDSQRSVFSAAQAVPITTPGTNNTSNINSVRNTSLSGAIVVQQRRESSFTNLSGNNHSHSNSNNHHNSSGRGNPYQHLDDHQIVNEVIEERFHLILEGRWERLKLIGRGSTGSVYKIILENGTHLAMKDLTVLPEDVSGQLEQVQKEIAIMRTVEHPHVLQYYAATFDEKDLRLNIFTELLPGGSLGDLVRELGQRLSELTAKSYIKQIVDGLAFVHDKGVIHRDLKADNVLLDGVGNAKIGDFGSSKAIASQGRTKHKAQTMVGTPVFMAPEILLGKPDGDAIDWAADGDEMMNQDEEELEGYGRKADIWSLGVLTAEVLDEGNHPWPRFANPGAAFLHISAPSSRPTPPSGISDEAKDFILSCCQRNPNHRPSAAELRSHAWFSEIQGMDTTSTGPLAMDSAASAVFSTLKPRMTGGILSGSSSDGHGNSNGQQRTNGAGLNVSKDRLANFGNPPSSQTSSGQSQQSRFESSDVAGGGRSPGGSNLAQFPAFTGSGLEGDSPIRRTQSGSASNRPPMLASSGNRRPSIERSPNASASGGANGLPRSGARIPKQGLGTPKGAGGTRWDGREGKPSISAGNIHNLEEVDLAGVKVLLDSSKQSSTF